MDIRKIEEIETKLAFQEKAVKELNDVIYEQQQQIDRLSLICEELSKQLRQAMPGPSNEKPPHY